MDAVQSLELIELGDHCLPVDVEDVLIRHQLLVRLFAQSPFLGHIFELLRVPLFVKLQL